MNSPIGQVWGRMSNSPAPFSITPRTMRRKCVSGNASPIHCAQRGMPRNGNMKPDNKMLGKKKNIVICIDCICDRASVENVKPTPSVATMKSTIAADSSAKLPNIGTSNSTAQQ